MKWPELLEMVADEPVFRTGFLAASGESLPAVRLPLTRWGNAGKLIQPARGLYTLAEQYRKACPHPFVLANAMKKGSYVSLQSALTHFGMIPEHVPSVTSVTTQRPQRIETPLGVFAFRRIKKDWFAGYTKVDLGNRQQAFVATPEKALLDLVYLTAGSDDPDFLSELRLQNPDRLDLDALTRLAEAADSPKLRRAATRIAGWVTQETGVEP
jgi:predicted transcriptional regulator of viral defense system